MGLENLRDLDVFQINPDEVLPGLLNLFKGFTWILALFGHMAEYKAFEWAELIYHYVRF